MKWFDGKFKKHYKNKKDGRNARKIRSVESRSNNLLNLLNIHKRTKLHNLDVEKETKKICSIIGLGY